VQEKSTPAGVEFIAGEWFYEEFKPGFGVRSIDMTPITLESVNNPDNPRPPN
jgi:hypothetical protein